MDGFTDLDARQCPIRSGRNFESEFVEDICAMLEMGVTRTISCHPDGNAEVENVNKTLKNVLIVKVNEDPDRWFEHIGACIMN